MDRWMDGQTDDGRQMIRKAHLNFQLRWAKKHHENEQDLSFIYIA